MGSKIKIQLYPSKIRRLHEISQQALKMTVETLLTDIRNAQTVPKETGELERSSFTDIDVKNMVGNIIFDTPYARKMYWHPEYNFRTDKNPNAGGLWMQPYVDGAKRDFVKETYAAFLKQLGGGLIK